MRDDHERLLDIREAIERIEKYAVRGREALLVTTQPLTAKERIETVFLLRSLRSLAVKNDEAEQ